MIQSLLDRFGIYIKLSTFGAGVMTMAVGAHKLADEYLEPDPAYNFVSVEIMKGNVAGLLLIDVIKARPECSRQSASLFVTFKDGTSRGFEVDMGYHLTPGRHKVNGTIAEGPLVSEIDKRKPVTFQTRHDCGEGLPPVVALCDAYFEGDPIRLCSEGQQ